MMTNNAAQTTLGYINRRYGSDVRSKEIFQDGEKYYIVEVEKRPGEVQPEFHVGGFAAHCSNTEDVWYYGKVVRTGEPREIIVRNGYFGYWTKFGERYTITENRIDEVLGDLNRKGYKADLISTDEYNIRYYWVYKPTKTGKNRNKFVKLAQVGKLDKTCQYYYDYNF